MVKKKGKEPDTPAKDEHFDPIELVSKKPHTVILMLKSEENSILQSACDALFRFASKCDENSRLLCTLDALDYVLPLISHAEKLVKRGAVMCLGVMSAQVAVQKALREGNWIPALISLLASEEESVFHEHASLTLSHLSASYTSKVAILDNGGLEPLISLLASSDCDVQKNAAETLSLVLEDYHCCLTFISLNGIEPLVNLLDSQYPVIQLLALATLHLVSKIESSLSILREGGCIGKLVEIVGNKDMDDLHVAALKVLANCLQDTETLEAVQEMGLIDSLLAFVAESNVSDVQVYAVKIISRVAKNDRNRKILHEQQVEKTLISMFTSENTAVLSPLADAIAVMAENASSCDALTKMGTLTNLLPMLRGDCSQGKEAAIKATNALVSDNSAARSELIEKNGAELLVHLVAAAERPPTLINAASAISCFSYNDTWRIELGKAGLIFSLSKAVADAIDADVQCSLCQCLAVFLTDDWARQDFHSADGSQILCKLISTKYDSVRDNACWLLAVACHDGVIARQLSKSGALQVLLDVNQSESRRSLLTANALDAILSNNLSAKYCIAGHLEATDLIIDHFYDTGKIRDGQGMPDFDTLLVEPVNNRRAVLLASTQKIQKRKRTTSSLDGSHQTAMNDNEDGGVENTDNSSDSLVDIPRDDALITLIENVMANVAKMKDQLEQIAAVARLVSMQMGGTVARDDLGSFHYELHISELKEKLNCNVIPIGMIEKGFYYHRAMLFKVLADRARINCTLVRGTYGRAWNIVTVGQEGQDGLVPKQFLLDLFHRPGNLLELSSSDSQRYQRM